MDDIVSQAVKFGMAGRLRASLCTIAMAMVMVMAVTSVTALAATEAGTAVFVRGVATVQGADGSTRILGANSKVFAGDVLRTGKKSYTVLHLADESKITLRPQTIFQVEEFKNEGSSSDSVFLRLFKGGLRTITGLIGKRNPRGFQLRSANATIGIRGTDFEARVCEEDCRQDVQGIRASRPTQPRVIGRVAFLSGALSAVGRNNQTRTLPLGGSLFEGDVMRSGPGAVAVLVFRDESRVTMRSSSTLELEQYSFEQDKPEEGSMFMRFISGGIRVVSGLIAKVRPRRVRVATPVATIAVRGTGFELKCEDPCSAAPQPQANPTPAATAQTQSAGMTTHVFDGAIELQLPGSTFVINQGSAVFFDGVSAPIRLPLIPRYFQQLGAAQPQLEEETNQNLLDDDGQTLSQQSEPEPGLYVRVIEGEVEVSRTDIVSTAIAGAGDTVFASPATVPLIKVQLQVQMPLTADPDVFTPQVQNALDLISGGDDGDQTEFQCIVQ
ncbi:MAG: hypothetical protein ACI8W7_004855 [Gammaproteobacteria bacterium]|jgi:hypothetical protein